MAVRKQGRISIADEEDHVNRAYDMMDVSGGKRRNTETSSTSFKTLSRHPLRRGRKSSVLPTTVSHFDPREIAAQDERIEPISDLDRKDFKEEEEIVELLFANPYAIATEEMKREMLDEATMSDWMAYKFGIVCLLSKSFQMKAKIKNTQRCLSHLQRSCNRLEKEIDTIHIKVDKTKVNLDYLITKLKNAIRYKITTNNENAISQDISIQLLESQLNSVVSEINELMRVKAFKEMVKSKKKNQIFIIQADGTNDVDLVSLKNYIDETKTYMPLSKELENTQNKVNDYFIDHKSEYQEEIRSLNLLQDKNATNKLKMAVNQVTTDAILKECMQSVQNQISKEKNGGAVLESEEEEEEDDDDDDDDFGTQGDTDLLEIDIGIKKHDEGEIQDKVSVNSAVRSVKSANLVPVPPLTSNPVL